MLFTFSITAPANTPKDSPVTQTLKLRAGVITKIAVQIPAGHAALAHLAIKHGETTIIPWGDDQWLEGDDFDPKWDEDILLPSEPAELTAVAWNEDDTYPHTFYIWIWIEREPLRLPVKLISDVLRLIQKLAWRVFRVK